VSARGEPDPVGIVRQTYEALNRRDPDALLEHMDPEVEFVSILARIEGEAGILRGHAGMRDYVTNISENWEDAHWDLLSVKELDDGRVFAHAVFKGRGPGSGIEIEQDVAIVVTARAGKALRIEGYASIDEARAAAGLD
jgi:ketosteroid isomerase-like protein